MQAWHGMAWHRLQQLGGSRTSLQPDASGLRRTACRRHPPRIAAASLIRPCGQAELIVSYPAFCLLFWARLFVWFHQHHAWWVFCFSVAVFLPLVFGLLLFFTSRPVHTFSFWNVWFVCDFDTVTIIRMMMMIMIIITVVVTFITILISQESNWIPDTLSETTSTKLSQMARLSEDQICWGACTCRAFDRITEKDIKKTKRVAISGRFIYFERINLFKKIISDNRTRLDDLPKMTPTTISPKRTRMFDDLPWKDMIGRRSRLSETLENLF